MKDNCSSETVCVVIAVLLCWMPIAGRFNKGEALINVLQKKIAIPTAVLMEHEEHEEHEWRCRVKRIKTTKWKWNDNEFNEDVNKWKWTHLANKNKNEPKRESSIARWNHDNMSIIDMFTKIHVNGKSQNYHQAFLDVSAIWIINE